MEMEDLKSGWKVLNERLSQNEKLNRKIIQEMIRKKTTSAYRKIFYTDIIGTILAIVVFIVLLGEFVRPMLWLKTRTIIFLEIFIFSALVIQAIEFYYFKRFSLESTKLVESAKMIMKYQWWFSKLKKYTPVGATVYMIIIFLLEKPAVGLPEMGVRFIAGTILLCILVWSGCYFYRNHLKDIEEGLKELKELEKEDTEESKIE